MTIDSPEGSELNRRYGTRRTLLVGCVALRGLSLALDFHLSEAVWVSTSWFYSGLLYKVGLFFSLGCLGSPFEHAFLRLAP